MLLSQIDTGNVCKCMGNRNACVTQSESINYQVELPHRVGD